MGFIVFILWLVLAFIIASAAKNKGRSYGGFLALSIFLSPLIGCLVLLVMGENKEAVEQKSIEDGDSKKCPYCAEIIKKDAKVCRYCGKDLPEDESKSIKPTEVKDDYEIISKNGKYFAIIKDGNPDNFYCPHCYAQVSANADSCWQCKKSF